jgi:hypothetical protein
MRINYRLSFLLTLAFVVGTIAAGALNHFLPPPVECHPAVVILEPDSLDPLFVNVTLCGTHFQVVFNE